MQLKLSTAHADWFSEHAWLSLPNIEIDHGKTTAKDKDGKKSNLKTPTENKKSVHFIPSESKQTPGKAEAEAEEGKSPDQTYKEELEQARE